MVPGSGITLEDSRHRISRRQVLVGCAAFLSCGIAAHRARAADAKRFAIKIAKGAVAKNNRTVRVREGNRVEIAFTSDRTLTLHLHGIDIETNIIAEKPAVMRFVATVAGRFPIEVHGGGAHRTLLYVEVHPR